MDVLENLFSAVGCGSDVVLLQNVDFIDSASSSRTLHPLTP